MRRLLQFACVTLCAVASLAVAQKRDQHPRAAFKVKYVDVKTVYIDAGKNAGLAPGMSLIVKRSRVLSNYSGDGQVRANVIIAKMTVVSVSNTSAMCEVRSQSSDVYRGDTAFLVEAERNTAELAARELRSPVFKPALNEIDSEREKSGTNAVRKTTVTSATVPKSAPPMSIADAARANRQQPLQADASASTPVAQPSSQNGATPAAPAVTGTQRAASTEPLSLGEIARRNRHSAQSGSTGRNDTHAAVAAGTPAAGTATTPAPQPADARITSPNGSRVEPAAPGATPSIPPVSASRTVPPEARPADATTAGKTSTTAGSTGAPASVPGALKAESIAALAADQGPASATKQPPVAPASPTVADGKVQSKPPATAKITAPSVPGSAPAKAATGTTAPAYAVGNAEASIARPANPEIAPAPAGGMNARLPVPVSPTRAEPVKVDFKVKYVAEDAIYIEGGKDAGLAEGMALSITRAGTASPAPQNIAEVTVVSVSNTSAVCEIREKSTDIERGDIALLSRADQQKIVEARTLSPSRKYPQVISFSEGDPLDEEARESVPKPPSPEVNRARGRIGVDYSFINSRGSGTTTNSMQTGGVVRVDMTRIGGSYWNLNGYWRGRVNLRSSSAQPQTVYDLVNRTYTIGFTYMNPGSRWTAGVGRLFLPWATSLDTIDGGYLGRKIGSHTTLGVFAGTTPDPASFDYNQDRRLAGTFVAFEAGSFDHLRFTSAEGVAVSAIEWREDRQFIFGENGLFYKRFLSIYHSAQADIQRLPTGGTTEGLSRSFATLRLQPWSRFSIDVNHNYFRDVPTFDPSLVGTGLLDKFLFQGISAGGRLELPGRISMYNNLGQSDSSADAHASLNQLYGLTLARLWKTGLRGDVRYSKFNSSFGHGNYRAASLSRNFSEVLRIEVNAGQQAFLSSLGVPTNYRLLGSTVDLNLGGHYFVESAFNLQRSSQQNFDQWLATVGYRFDSGRRK